MFRMTVDEDAYWERVREALENPRRPPDWEPEPESDWLWLDEEADGIEAEYDCRMQDLPEGDLMDILDRFVSEKKEWLSAVWYENLCGIKYTYPAEEW